MSTLFLVATPIGNLEDISARALRTLREVRLITAEDTRHTGKLLHHFGIPTRLTSYFEHNELRKLDDILNALTEGDVALVSDAGTPALNDPGFLLVRAALQAGHRVSPIPGPSAPIAALTASGLPTDHFLYLGYLPRKASERRKAIEIVKDLPYTLIWFETPHRMDEALADLEDVLGDRQIAVAGELTKLFEEITRASLSETRRIYREKPARGEYTLVVAGHSGERATWDEGQVRATVLAALAAGERPTPLAKRLAAESGWPRREVYALITELQKGAE
ncbi:MAG: 16S rRNA (cytidine(1402)-2'-O)-methyltransferase [Anaerolineae bacterium]|nr:MAG: 16S rRNA (cytidine(1402)-2'-O)-methyltransferase [Anaerolineae bacterium]